MSKHHRHFFQSLPHHSHQNSAKGPLVHIRGTIAAVLSSGEGTDGGRHQHLQVHVDKTLEIQGANGDIDGQTLFVAIRFGDSEGIPTPIPNLEVQQPIEAQGEYIDAMRAEPGTDNRNPVLPVLHFTHHPYGFIIYEGQEFA
ncbi:MAG: hypothetical protein PUP92_18820 [Rhizonema sp. PD38]|nr:hypothetical protein [Rhizonema sp. PD38]